MIETLKDKVNTAKSKLPEQADAPGTVARHGSREDRLRERVARLLDQRGDLGIERGGGPGRIGAGFDIGIDHDLPGLGEDLGLAHVRELGERVDLLHPDLQQDWPGRAPRPADRLGQVREKDGRLSAAAVRACARRVLQLAARLGSFADPLIPAERDDDLPAHRTTARRGTGATVQAADGRARSRAMGSDALHATGPLATLERVRPLLGGPYEIALDRGRQLGKLDQLSRRLGV